VPALSKIQNKQNLIPPKNGGSLAKTLNSFDGLLSSFFNSVTNKQFSDRPINAEPETILRSEIGTIRHEPTPAKSAEVKQPVVYQELPDKDFQTFFVEIEPRKPKTAKGFFITRPEDSPHPISSQKDDPVVEITRELVVNPESQELPFSSQDEFRAPIKTPPPSRVPFFPDSIQPVLNSPVNPQVDVLPMRTPAAPFNTEEPQSPPSPRIVPPKTTTTTTTTPRSTNSPYRFVVVSTETPAPFARNPENENRSTQRFLPYRPESSRFLSEDLAPINRLRGSNSREQPSPTRAPFSDISDEAVNFPIRENESTIRPSQPIVPSRAQEQQQSTRPRFSSRENIAARNPDPTNRVRFGSQEDEQRFSTARPTPLYNSEFKVNSREKVNDHQIHISPNIGDSKEVSRAPASREKDVYRSNERAPEYQSRDKTSNEARRNPVSISRDPVSEEEVYQPIITTPASVSNEEAYEPTTAPPRSRFTSHSVEDTSRELPSSENSGSASVEVTEKPDSGEKSSQEYSSSSEKTTKKPIFKISVEDYKPTSVEEYDSSFDSGITTRRPTIRIRTTSAEPEHKVFGRKPVKISRGELKNQRLIASKIKRVRKPTTVSPEPIDLDDKKSYINDNQIFSTIKPIIVGAQDLDEVGNVTKFRFTVEDNEYFTMKPKVYGSGEEITEKERQVVRPAYQPINLDTLESAEEPIPPKPSTELPTREQSTKPSRGRASLKPRYDCVAIETECPLFSVVLVLPARFGERPV